MHPSMRRPPPKVDDKTPVVLTYGPFTLRKTELGTWTLEAPASFTTDDIDKLGALAQWAKQTVGILANRRMGILPRGHARSRRSTARRRPSRLHGMERRGAPAGPDALRA